MGQELTNRADRLRALIAEKFSPALLEIEDQSARHAGHAGARPGGETHFAVKLRAEAFRGLSRVAMHRAVNDALASEFESGLHALTLDLGVAGD